MSHLPARSLGPVALLGVALLVAPRRVAAQVTVLDEGTFSLSLAGERVGREDFSIRSTRSGGVVAYILQGTVLNGEQRLTTALTVDSAGVPARLQSELRDGAEVVETYAGRRERGIWSGRAVRPDGESAREAPFPAGALAIDERLIHHLWLILRFAAGEPVPIIAPRTFTELNFRVENRGSTRIALGLRELDAQQWVVREASGGRVLWEVWTDGAGRLLRVFDPIRGFDAVRDEPPN